MDPLLFLFVSKNIKLLVMIKMTTLGFEFDHSDRTAFPTLQQTL